MIIVKELTRRTMLQTAICGAGLMIGNGCMKKGGDYMGLKKSDFYENGTFNAEKAKQAYFKLMKKHDYPISDVLKTEEFWVCDFLQQDFLHLGMGGIFWMNAKGNYGKNGAGAYKGKFKDQNYGYLGHEIYVLPGQMLPEHRHIGGTEGYGPKMESWHVRYGEAEFFGQYKGAGDEKLIKDMPENEHPWGYGQKWFKAKYVARRTAKSGKLYTLQDPESWHFLRGGAKGAIISEYATYHNHVEFSKPGLKFDNSKAS